MLIKGTASLEVKSSKRNREFGTASLRDITVLVLVLKVGFIFKTLKVEPRGESNILIKFVQSFTPWTAVSVQERLLLKNIF